ncbi:DUF5391 family protein [Agathobaculum sp. Marseille-P7918]|uniref:DUF5391 family protein n=1 Tax=Agathobaculum sp. Marseille-P7918 TaxID=2479843 RepID=UPI000F639782|nr:DUF5391 family protein [Agathobaculum sp. Marseille-P7918]
MRKTVRKSVVGWAVGLAVLWVMIVLAISLSPTMQGSIPYFGGFGSRTMWLAAALAAVVYLLPAILYGVGLHWAKYLLAVINGAVMILTLVLLGLMAVMVMFQIGVEGWYVMGLDLWFVLVAVLGIAAFVFGFLWFRAAFPVRGSDKV